MVFWVGLSLGGMKMDKILIRTHNEMVNIFFSIFIEGVIIIIILLYIYSRLGKILEALQ